MKIAYFAWGSLLWNSDGLDLQTRWKKTNINLPLNFSRISDNGKGIPEDRQNKVFVPYFTTKSTGTGIGLSITKQIIENHNGKIYFESKENLGTSFYIELPLLD